MDAYDGASTGSLDGAIRMAKYRNRVQRRKERELSQAIRVTIAEHGGRLKSRQAVRDFQRSLIRRLTR